MESATTVADNATGLTPFKVEIEQAQLEDLKARLESVRWPTC